MNRANVPLGGTYPSWLAQELICFLPALLLVLSCAAPPETAEDHRRSEPLTIVAIGDVGENTSELRANAAYITDMYTGRHDGGIFDAMIFLGDNFYTTGLNVPVDEVDRKVESVLGKFKVPMTGVGRANVHAIPGNHDYYARNVLEASVLFGLIDIEVGPIGLTEKGNMREAAIEYWTYHYKMPAYTVYPLQRESRDSVQLIFFDSAVLLRTDPQTWHPSLDSLRRILAGAKNRPGISWRVLCTHHPFRTIGEHGGYTVWNDETNMVEYLTACDKDSNALGWLKNWVDPEDLCTPRYRQYLDSMRASIMASDVRIQLVLSGHDHCLQLLYSPGENSACNGCPKVQIVSGAGSEGGRVRSPSPPNEFTSAQNSPSKKGESLPGFVQLRFEKERLRAVFFNAENGNRLDMGDGRTEFWIDKSGDLLNK